MARIVSLVVLIAVLLLTVWLFFKVMAGFLLPLFLAVLLVVMFGPLHRWLRAKCGRHDRIAAALATVVILLIVLVPLSLLLLEAGREAQSLYENALAPATSDDAAVESISQQAGSLGIWVSNKIVELAARVGITLDAGDLQGKIGDGLRRFLAPLALRTTQFLGDMLLSLFIMILATYYFFADGPMMVQAVLRLSPVEPARMCELIDQFDGVTRAVVTATLASAVVQGFLAGIGFYFAGAGAVFLLTALSMLLTLVPFVGAALVWVPVCLWLFAIKGHVVAAVVLAAYCIGVVSMADNVVKPLVLHGRSNLHPLLALLSVLGGAQALGPIGILVGPMIVAFLQTLLNIVHAELGSMGDPSAGAGQTLASRPPGAV